MKSGHRFRTILRAAAVAALAVPFATLPGTVPAAYASGHGNSGGHGGGGGHGNSGNSGGDHGNSGNHGNSGTHGNGAGHDNSGGGSGAGDTGDGGPSGLGSLNAAHASLEGLQHASPNSVPGKLNIYREGTLKEQSLQSRIDGLTAQIDALKSAKKKNRKKQLKVLKTELQDLQTQLTLQHKTDLATLQSASNKPLTQTLIDEVDKLLGIN